MLQFDVYNLEKLFEQLYFKVEKHRNLNKRDFDRIIYEFSRNPGKIKSTRLLTNYIK